MDKSNRQFVHEFIAGNVGGILGISAVSFIELYNFFYIIVTYDSKVYPLDTVKTRLQVIKEFKLVWYY